MKNTEEVSVREEVFARRLAAGRETQAKIYRDLYPKSRGWKAKTVHEKACRLAGKVRARVREIQASATDATIMDIIRRKQVLSEIAGADPLEFYELDENGDVNGLKFGRNTPRRSAVLKLVTKKISLDGAGGAEMGAAVVEELRLRDPIAAIDTLNKMDGVYKDDAGGDKDKQYVMIMGTPDGKRRK